MTATTTAATTMTDLRPLSVEEIAELRAYSSVEGRGWKDRLQTESWWRGIPARDKTGREYPLLYGLRNTHGPSWLVNFKLPKEGDDMSASFAARVNAIATRESASPKKRPRKTPVDGPWEMSGPEEGDSDDTVLVCNNDADGYEVIEIKAGPLATRKRIARRIADLLNEGEGVLL
jgi:hypothetical protein